MMGAHTLRTGTRATTTELVAWQVVADLLDEIRLRLVDIVSRAERREVEAVVRPLARAVTRWQTVAPLEEQTQAVLALLLEVKAKLPPPTR